MLAMVKMMMMTMGASRMVSKRGNNIHKTFFSLLIYRVLEL